jgi:ABC-type arginine/histidine transport system permease subunit
MERMPAERQTFLFTATLRRAVEDLANEVVREPFRYGGNSTAARTIPTAYDCRDAAKTPLLLHLLKEPTRTGVLVFTRTRRRAGWVAGALKRHKITTGLLHGDRSQKQREAALAVGMTERMTLWLILLPQATRRMIPALTNELINVIKASALLSVIAVNELTKVGNAIIYNTFYFVEVLIEVALLYMIVIGLISWLSKYLENKVFAFGSTIAINETR